MSSTTGSNACWAERNLMPTPDPQRTHDLKHLLGQVIAGDLLPEKAELRARALDPTVDDLFATLGEIGAGTMAAQQGRTDPHSLLLAARVMFRLAEPTTEPDLLATSAGLIGMLVCITGDNMGGIPWFEQALEWAKASRNPAIRTATLGDLANAYRNVGRLRAAQRAYNEAIAIARRPGLEQFLVNHLNNLAIVHDDLGDRIAQGETLREALNLARALGLEEKLMGLATNLGILYRSLGDYEGAVRFYREALSIAERRGHDRWRAALLANLGQSYLDLGETDAALCYYKEGLQVAERTGDASVQASCMLGLANIYADQGETRSAQHVLEHAVELSQRQGSPGLLISALKELGEFYERRLQAPRPALDLYRQAVKAGESLREELTRPGEGPRICGSLSDIYTRLVGLSIQEERFNEAFAFSERARAALLLRKLGPRPPARDSMRKGSASRAYIGHHLPLGALRSHLRHVGPQAVLISYFVTSEMVYTFILRADEEQVHCEPRRMGQGELEHLREAFEHEVIRYPDHGYIGEAWLGLSRFLIDPVLSYLREGDTLFLVPHGPLHNLPLHALKAGKQRLIERWPVAYLPAASALPALTDESPGPPDGPVVVGVHFTDEAKAVASLLGADQGLIGDAVDKAAVLDALTKADLVHISAYGFSSQGQPGQSGWLLHRSSEVDDYLAAREKRGFQESQWDMMLTSMRAKMASETIISAADLESLRLPAKMVTISACQSGLVYTGVAEDPVGIVPALLVAGVQSVVAALWLVEPVATQRLVLAFYRLLRQSEPGWGHKPQALRLAMLDVMRDYPHPYFWAPFVIIGGAAPGVADPQGR